MNYVYIIENIIFYEVSEVIGVCVDDIEVAKRIAQEYHDKSKKTNEPLEWDVAEIGIIHSLFPDSRYLISKFEVTEQ